MTIKILILDFETIANQPFLAKYVASLSENAKIEILNLQNQINTAQNQLRQPKSTKNLLLHDQITKTRRAIKLKLPAPNKDILQEENQTLIESICEDIENTKYKKIRFAVSSIHQSKKKDDDNCINHILPSCFSTMNVFCDLIQELTHHPDCSVEPMLLPDIYRDHTIGYSFYNAIHFPHDISQDHPDWRPTLIDSCKISIVCAQIYRAVTQNPEEQDILCEFIDSRDDVLACVKGFFEYCSKVIPPQVTLKLKKNTGRDIEDVAEFKGHKNHIIKNHIINYNYRENIKSIYNLQNNFPIVQNVDGVFSLKPEHLKNYKRALEQEKTNLLGHVTEFEAAKENLQAHLYQKSSLSSDDIKKTQARQKLIEVERYINIEDSDETQRQTTDLENIAKQFLMQYPPPKKKINIRSLAISNAADPVPENFSAADPQYQYIIFSAAEGTPGCIQKIKELALQSNGLIDPFLLADIFNQTPVGYCFNHPHAIPAAENMKYFVFAEMWRIVAEFPDADEIVYDFYDPNQNNLNIIHDFFNQDTLLIPKKITLRIPGFTELKGTNAQSNLDYIKTTRTKAFPSLVASAKTSSGAALKLERSLAKPRKPEELALIQQSWLIYDAMKEKIKNPYDQTRIILQEASKETNKRRVEKFKSTLNKIKDKLNKDTMLYSEVCENIKKCINFPKNKHNITQCIQLREKLNKKSGYRIAAALLTGLAGILLIGFAIGFALSTKGIGTPLSLLIGKLGLSMIVSSGLSLGIGVAGLGAGVGTGFLVSWAMKPKQLPVAETFEPFYNKVAKNSF